MNMGRGNRSHYVRSNLRESNHFSILPDLLGIQSFVRNPLVLKPVWTDLSECNHGLTHRTAPPKHTPHQRRQSTSHPSCSRHGGLRYRLGESDEVMVSVKSLPESNAGKSGIVWVAAASPPCIGCAWTATHHDYETMRASGATRVTRPRSLQTAPLRSHFERSRLAVNKLISESELSCSFVISMITPAG
jgi:hypothetical protein